MSKNKIVYIGLSFVISVVLIYILLNQIKPEDVSLTIRNLYYPGIIIFIIIAFTGSILRAVRYKMLLSPHSINFGNIFLVTLVRNLFVDLLPARIGSFSYIYILNKRFKYKFEEATSTFVISIVFDFITLSPFLILSIFAVGLGKTFVSSWSFLALSFIFLLLILFILWQLTSILSIILKLYASFLKLFKLDSHKWAQISIKKIELTIESTEHIKKRNIYWKVFSVSFLIRLAKYASIYFLLFSLLKSFGFTLSIISLSKTVLGITGAELTSILPVKGIGGFGTWESAWALTLNLMNFESRLAIISGIGVHLITNLFEYSLGIISILILAIPFLKKRNKKTNGIQGTN
ncbi:MAG: lysylphosphatidylglycerol synthase transmembrane domain-containing protein [Candidatus Aminicenantaceae bacterium]